MQAGQRRHNPRGLPIGQSPLPCAPHGNALAASPSAPLPSPRSFAALDRKTGTGGNVFGMAAVAGSEPLLLPRSGTGLCALPLRTIGLQNTSRASASSIPSSSLSGTGVAQAMSNNVLDCAGRGASSCTRALACPAQNPPDPLWRSRGLRQAGYRTHISDGTELSREGARMLRPTSDDWHLEQYDLPSYTAVPPLFISRRSWPWAASSSHKGPLHLPM